MGYEDDENFLHGAGKEPDIRENEDQDDGRLEHEKWKVDPDTENHGYVWKEFQ